MTCVAAIALGAGCGRELAPDPSAVPDRCRVDAPFGSPAALTGWLPGKSILSARRAKDDGWYLSIDETPLGKTTGRLGLYVERNGALEPTESAIIAQLASPADAGVTNDEQPTVSPDGLRLLFQSDRDRGTAKLRSFRLYLAERATLRDPFGPPRQVTVGVSTDPSRSEEEPYFGGGGRVVFSFQGVREGSTEEETVFGATLGRGPDGAPALEGPGSFGTLDTAVEDGHPVISEDGEEIFWASERDTDPNAPDENVWHAVRSGATFGAPERMTVLSQVGATDYPTYLTPDRCALYIIRKESDALKRVYVARRSR